MVKSLIPIDSDLAHAIVEALEVLADDAVEAGYPARAEDAAELAANVRAAIIASYSG